MPGFDQQTWERETTWGADLPSYAEVFGLLQAPELPDAFRTLVQRGAKRSTALKAALAHHLTDQGLSSEAVRDSMRSVAPRITRASLDDLLAMAPERRPWSIRFANLVSGRFTELVFERAFRPQIEQLGLTLSEETAERSFVDYRISEREGDFALALNLKNAGVQMRDALKWFGLSPEDTLPIATYKIFGSELAGIPPLIYVYLVDWTLIDRLREAYWTGLSDTERQAFRLIACFRGVPRDVEDAYITFTVGERLDALLERIGYDPDSLDTLPFRVVSGARCRAIFLQRHDRSPYVFRQRMKTDPNVHISVKDETVSFADFAERWLTTAEARAQLLQELSRKTKIDVPDPPV